MAATVVAALAIMLSGCSTFKNLFGSSGEEIEVMPQELVYEGMEHMQAGRYGYAAESFRKLKDRFPFSKYAILAELKVADALYMDKSYIEAAEAYAEFEQLHPKNQAVPYVIYQLGMCYLKQMNGFERDQAPTVQAIQTFHRLIQTYPDSEHAQMATARMVEAEEVLAHHEFSVGEFYFNMDAYNAALGRFTSLLKNYPDSGYHHRALEYIQQCRVLIAEQEAEGKGSQARQAPDRSKMVEDQANPLPGSSPTD